MSEATVAELFLEAPRARRIEAIEWIRQETIDEGRCPPDQPLSQPSLTWLRRMQCALADEEVSQHSFDELASAYKGYLATLPEPEAGELHCRIGQFLLIRDELRGCHE